MDIANISAPPSKSEALGQKNSEGVSPANFYGKVR